MLIHRIGIRLPRAADNEKKHLSNRSECKTSRWTDRRQISGVRNEHVRDDRIDLLWKLNASCCRETIAYSRRFDVKNDDLRHQVPPLTKSFRKFTLTSFSLVDGRHALSSRRRWRRESGRLIDGKQCFARLMIYKWDSHDRFTDICHRSMSTTTASPSRDQIGDPTSMMISDRNGYFISTILKRTT